MSSELPDLFRQAAEPTHGGIAELDDATLSAVAGQVRSSFLLHAPSYRICDINEFLDLTRQIAEEMGISDDEETTRLLEVAARTYMAIAIQDRIEKAFAFEWPDFSSHYQTEIAFSKSAD